jgi:flagellar basal body-associated protein FliL
MTTIRGSAQQVAAARIHMNLRLLTVALIVALAAAVLALAIALAVSGSGSDATSASEPVHVAPSAPSMQWGAEHIQPPGVQGPGARP